MASAPEKFASQRQALIGEIETATAARRADADRLAAAENDLAEADKVARAALEAVGEARAEAARGEERCDPQNAGSPISPTKSANGSKSSRTAPPSLPK